VKGRTNQYPHISAAMVTGNLAVGDGPLSVRVPSGGRDPRRRRLDKTLGESRNNGRKGGPGNPPVHLFMCWVTAASPEFGAVGLTSHGVRARAKAFSYSLPEFETRE
jgi:hypothetical protein